MKFRIYGMVLSLLFALGLVFSFGIEASASHGDGTGITAADVDPTSEVEVKAFLDHIIDYYNQVVAENVGDNDALTRGVVIYGRALRQEGTYKYFENSMMPMYSMGISASGTLTNHAGYPNLFGYQFNSGATGSTVANTIQTLIANSAASMPDCQSYGDQGRVACATKVQSPTGDVTVIAGLHHAADDSAFSLPNCSDFTLDTTAEKVFTSQNDTDLEAYVKGAIEVVQQQVANATNAQLQEFTSDPANLLKLQDLQDPTSPTAIEFGRGILQRVYAKSACFGAGDFKHGNIYAFIMSADPMAATVLFNGNNFDLNGANLELVDDQLSGEQNIARLFNQKLGDPVNGASTYVNYHWDDPTTTDDDVPNFFEERKVPGTSCKRSYIEVADINAAITPSPGVEILYIFGSGTYPGDDVCAGDDGGDGSDDGGDGSDDGGDGGDDGDDGCAISGTEHTSQSTLLNLFLIASVLFSVVFLRRRV